MAETTFPALVTYNDQNIRKALKGGLLIAPFSTALPSSVTVDSAGSPGTPVLQTLTGFSSLGRFTDNGAVMSEGQNDSTITPWGALAPSRRDITSDVTTLKVEALETNKSVLAARFGVDASTLVPDATTAELHVTKQLSPIALYWRLILLTQDGAANSEYWQGAIFPKASLTGIGDMTFMSGDTAILYDMTFTMFVDAAAGFDVRNFYAGPGWKTNKTGAGF